MILSLSLAGLISSVLTILFGVIVIGWKKSLNYLVGIYFVVIGLLGLLAAI